MVSIGRFARYTSGKSRVNYRPISLLCIVSKVLEHLVYNKVSTFIVNNNILCHQQSGFRQHHSTTQQLYAMFTELSLTAINVMSSTLTSKEPLTVSHIKNYCWSYGRLVLWEACGDGSVNTYPTMYVLTTATLLCYQYYQVFPRGAYLALYCL